MSTNADSISFDAFDRDNGTGSRSLEEDWLDANNRVQDNKWTSANTTFWPRSADGNGNKLSGEQRKRFRELRKVHDRFASSSDNRKTTIRYGHIMNDVYTFCNICGLDERETETVATLIKETDISSKNYGGKRYEKIILALMSLVVDANIETAEEMDQRLILQDDFKELMENTEFSSGELRTVRQMIRERIDLDKEI